MKVTIFKTSVLISIILFTFSCGSDYDANYIAVSDQVRDSIYSSNKDKLGRFFKNIEMLELKTIFPKKATIIDSTSNIENILDSELNLDTAFTSDSLSLTAENTILIHNPSNWILYYDSTDSTNLATKFVVTKLKNDGYSTRQISSYDRIPDYYDFSYLPKREPTYPDSINAEQKLRAISRYSEEIKELEAITYGITINDLFISKPALIDKDNFSSGLIISELNIYDLNSKEHLGNTTIFSENRDKISHMFTMDFGELTKNAIDFRLKEDLLQQKNKNIIESLNIK